MAATIHSSGGGCDIFRHLGDLTGPKENFYTAKMGKLWNPMARPRTATSVLHLRGAFKNHPSRLRDRKNEPIVTTALPEPPTRLSNPVKATWLEIQSYGHWLTSADRFLVEIAAALIVRYRLDDLKSGDVSLLIGLLGKIGFSPKERGALNLPTRSTHERP